MKRTLIQSTLLAFCVASPLWAAPKSDTAIEIVMDDSGVLQSPESAHRSKMIMLSQLKGLTRRRNLAYARIDVISMSYGRTVWTGTPLDLKHNAVRAKDLVEKVVAMPENCNAMTGAFNELKSNMASLAREGVNKVHIMVFSSLIHTPLPCDGTVKLSLPQLPPLKGDIPGALTASDLTRSISFYHVSPHQKYVWEDYLKPVFDWAASRSVPVLFLDEERSTYALGISLSGLEVRDE